MNVKEILSNKRAGTVTVRPQETINTLSHRLRLERIGAVVVSADGEHVDGIISERDIVHGVAEYGEELLDMPVSDLMTRQVATCATDDSLKALMHTMTTKRIRHLPVVEDGRLVGIVSIGDVVKNRLDEMEMETAVLRDYAIARA